MVPENIRPFFWDVDVESFDPRQYPDYTIARLLEYGNREALSWLRSLFSEQEIKKVIRTERRLTRRSATFWGLVYHLPSEQITALRCGGSADLSSGTAQSIEQA
jgi:hypothetical protein